MDISAILNENQNGAANSAAPTGTNGNGSTDPVLAGLNTVPTDTTNDSTAGATPTGNGGLPTIQHDHANRNADGGNGAGMDPLANFNPEINPEPEQPADKVEYTLNKTIKTSDNSAVGDYNTIHFEGPEVPDPVRKKQEEPEPEPEPAPAPVVKPEVHDDSEYDITDPAKMDFIKTYTKEYDDLVVSTTHAVELILKSIDKTVKDHANDIAIPEEATPFIDKKIENGRVQKFDEAQEIVRTVMDKATTAKQQAEQAAKEAAQIYDNIQQFKKDTSDQIADIRNRDEFGRPKDAKRDAAADATNLSGLPTISRR